MVGRRGIFSADGALQTGIISPDAPQIILDVGLQNIRDSELQIGLTGGPEKNIFRQHYILDSELHGGLAADSEEDNFRQQHLLDSALPSGLTSDSGKNYFEQQRLLYSELPGGLAAASEKMFSRSSVFWILSCRAGWQLTLKKYFHAAVYSGFRAAE